MRASMWGMSNASHRLWIWLPSSGSCGPNMALTPPLTWLQARSKQTRDLHNGQSSGHSVVWSVRAPILGLIVRDSRNTWKTAEDNGRQCKTNAVLDINSKLINADRDRYKHWILLCVLPLWPNYWWQSINGIDFHGCGRLLMASDGNRSDRRTDSFLQCNSIIISSVLSIFKNFWFIRFA